MPSTKELAKPLYAWAGAGDLAVAKLRQLPSRYAQRQEFAKRQADALRRQVRELDLAAVRQAVEGYADEAGSKAQATYQDLVVRGQRVVRRINRQKATQDLLAALSQTRRQAKGTVTTARTSATSTRRRAKATATSAKQAAAAAGRAVEDGAAKLG